MVVSRDQGQQGRRLAILIAGVGLFWIIVTGIGTQYGWSQRTRALFDLIALAGFGAALWKLYGLWRNRQ